VAAAGAYVALHKRAVAAVSLTALVVLAAVLRVWQLTAVGFGGDEAVYAGQSALLAGEPGMERWFIPASRGNSNFLGAQWLISLVFRMVGVSDFAARFVSVVASVATVVLVILIARQLYGRLTEALLAGLVMTVSGYAVLLGRLALLDATACFFLTLAVYFLTLWMATDHPLWLGLFVVAGTVGVQVKVTTALVFAIAGIVVLVSGHWRRFGWRLVLAMVCLGVLSFTPALAEMWGNTGGWRDYLGSSTARTSAVPWHYYPSVLWSSEGPLLWLVMLLGVVVAVVGRDRKDLLPLVWVGVYAAFLQSYPLKGFNYLLPLVPPLALLAARGVVLAVGLAQRHVRWDLRLVAPLAGLALVLSQVGALAGAIGNDRSAGMREAALWLRAHGADRAGTIALSHGSGQYVLPFYGGVDAYPYGRFRIATVLPGGHVVKATARKDGAVPLDWVSRWPARLIDEGRVSYLVYQTRPLDDPPEQSEVAGTVTEKQFRSFIARYGGRLVHRVYKDHEARVYIYRITRRLPHPVVTVRPLTDETTSHTAVPVSSSPDRLSETFAVTARGFAFRSPVTVRYHGRQVRRVMTDSTGTARLRLRVPISGLSQYHVVVNDRHGNSASSTGVSRTRLTYRVKHGVVRVSGSGFEPGGDVAIFYHSKAVATTTARADGTITWPLRLPRNTHPRFRILARGAGGRAAYATGLAAPSLAFVATGNAVRLSGKHFSSSSVVTLTMQNRPIGSARTDRAGRFALRLRLPPTTHPTTALTATDRVGRQATVTGLVQR
jgi:hypothetical protein